MHHHHYRDAQYTKEFIGEDENSLVLDVLSNDVDVDQGDTINITSVGEVLDSAFIFTDCFSRFQC
jgi:hypothetical protein